jgi:DNA-damage-inducible protein J
VLINIFVKTTVREKRVPFELSVDPFYSAENQAKLLEAMEQMESIEKY